MSTTEVACPAVAPVTRREVLHRAADLIETNEWPWVQGFQTPNGSGACLMMATYLGAGYSRSAYFSADTWPWQQTIAEALGFSNSPEAVGWNDEPGRTKAEVVARLREAAEASA